MSEDASSPAPDGAADAPVAASDVAAEASGPVATATPTKRRTWLFYVIAACVLFLDQASKLAVVAHMQVGDSFPALGSVLQITYRHNTGAAFSILPSATVGLAVLAAIVIVVLLVFGRQAAARSAPLLAGLSLQLGGAAGNFVDRVRLGYVVDFIDLRVWPVFNVADIGITCGAILVVAAILFDPRLKDIGAPIAAA
jgi:signal peptidase II